MKAHLLFRDADLAITTTAQDDDTIVDLGLDTIIATMASGDTLIEDIARGVLLVPLVEVGAITYRQAASRDAIEHTQILIEIYAITADALSVKKALYGSLISYPVSILYHSLEAMNQLLPRLRTLRDLATRSQSTFHSEAFTTLCQTLQDELSEGYLLEVTDLLNRLAFKHGITLSAQLGAGNTADNYVLRRIPEATGPWFHKRVRLPGPVLSYRLPDRDEAGSSALAELRSRAINDVANAAARSVDHVQSFFAALRTEIAFYLGAANLDRALHSVGSPTSFARVEHSEEALFVAKDAYDVALALTSGTAPVSNNINAQKTRLVVITGANQGGKTTFLRAIGQNTLLAQAGLPSGASALTLSPCSRLFTHFKREEDTATDSGKFDDELTRMSDIASQLERGSVVLFNEPFASTNEREGSEIGRQIVHALIDNGVRVFLVTHLYDLASSLYSDHQGTHLFLRAERGTGGQRTFRMVVAEPLSTSFGRDLYQRIFNE